MHYILLLSSLILTTTTSQTLPNPNAIINPSNQRTAHPPTPPPTPTKPPTNTSLNDSQILPKCYAPTHHLPLFNANDCRLALYLLLKSSDCMQYKPWDQTTNLPLEIHYQSCSIALSRLTPNADDYFQPVLIAHAASVIMQTCAMPRYASLWGQAKVGYRGEFAVYVSAAKISSAGSGKVNGTAVAVGKRGVGAAVMNSGASIPSSRPADTAVSRDDSVIVPTCYVPSRPFRTINSEDCNVAIYMILTMQHSMEPMTWDKTSRLPSEARGPSPLFQYSQTSPANITSQIHFDTCSITLDRIDPDAEDVFQLVLVAAAAAKIMQTCQAPPFVEFWGEAIIGARGRFQVLVQAGMGGGGGEGGIGALRGVVGGGSKSVGTN